MLRNPVDVMYAQHNQLIFNVIEDIPDFAEALAAEPDGARASASRRGPINVENLFYRHSVRFAEQLERYFEVFGRDRVHVMLHDDLRRDGAGIVRGVLEFLGVDPSLRRRAAEVEREPARPLAGRAAPHLRAQAAPAAGAVPAPLQVGSRDADADARR